ncbi:MAG: helix-turn-helix transcriptional regulator [Halobacteriales archaeon]
MAPSSPGSYVRRVLPVVALLVLLVAAQTSGAARSGTQDDEPLALAQTAVEPDAVLLAVDLAPDGDGVWRVEYRVRLTDANDTAAFEDLQADVEANRSAYVSRFADRMAATVGEAERATGREMALRNVSVTTTIEQLPRTYGVVVYTFEWTNFAAVEGDRLRAGDALAGLFLDDDTSFLVSWPDGYALLQVSPEPDEAREHSVVWRGPTDFGPGDPTVVVAPGGGSGPGEPSLVGLAIVLLVLAVGGAVWWWHRSASRPTPAPDGPTDEGASGANRPDAELLSNEERVLALLEEHGGRMKQQDVVQALDWTDAKTSQVVGKLRDAGEIEGFRLGRENVLRLPEVDESPGPENLAPDADEE